MLGILSAHLLIAHYQTTLSASLNVSRTSSFNGCRSDGIDGIAAKASSTPCACGNFAGKNESSFFFSSFCKTSPPIMMPQIYAARY